MQMLSGFFFALLGCLPLVHGHEQTGFISIDCGNHEDFSYTDIETHINYVSDKLYIDTGENMNISSDFKSETLQKPFLNVRSFPGERKNCYTLKPEGGKAKKYLIRASFMYGNYDGMNRLPKFDLYLGVNLWNSVQLDNASHVQMEEIIHIASMDYIHVCLMNKDLGTPFISALELRPLSDSIYVAKKSGSLALFRRFDVGSTTNKNIRFVDDEYDRIWSPYPGPWDPFSTPLEVNDPRRYKVPSTVMNTAARPRNGTDSIIIELQPADPTSEFYVFMHVADLELLQSNQLRKFNISVNGRLFSDEPVLPEYLSTTTVSSTELFTGDTIVITISKTTDCTLPPILNALEIYVLKEIAESPTNSDDVDAIMNIKKIYGVTKHWVGDPCTPRNFSWEGLNCIYDGNSPPRIISLDLASSGLSGEIAACLANLSSIQSLDLSRNNLEGPVPDFLAKLPNLTILNLTGNQLTGSIPMVLIEKSINGLLLSVGGNPNLCPSVSCKKSKKIIIPVLASISSAMVLLMALLILWSLKRRRQKEPAVDASDNKEALESKNRLFTYAEVVSITNDFRRVIGRGGSGTVYHGYLKDNTQVAVKMLSSSTIQGSEEVQTEAKLLMGVHHRNLASFIGYCNEGNNMALIYEYMANGNLQEYLTDQNANVLSWEERLRIAVDAAQGLEYLHNGCKKPIVHRDVKTANILLDERLQATVADFGCCKVFPDEGDTHVSTKVIGTTGYLDPEYHLTNRLNEKSDVYSFGIVLLELITGQPAIIKGSECIHIVKWVNPMLARGQIRNIVDPRLQGDFDVNSTWKAIEIAMACTPSISIQRPTMSRVLMELKECLAIETARKTISRAKDDKATKLGNSLVMLPMDYEIEIGPSAR